MLLAVCLSRLCGVYLVADRYLSRYGDPYWHWRIGGAAALSSTCWPTLTGHLPVIYPFVINDPGEAAQAKRRIGALTLGRIPPPLRVSSAPAQFSGRFWMNFPMLMDLIQNGGKG